MDEMIDFTVHTWTSSARQPFSHEGTTAHGRPLPLIRVGGQSPAGDVAGAITEAIKRYKVCEVTMIGAQAISQGVKALAISRGHLASLSLDLVLRPAFFNTDVHGKEMTGLKFSAAVMTL
jgi:stage V sporulation protein SpoVS